MTTHSDTEQVAALRRPRLLYAARRLVDLARDGRPVAEAIDLIAGVLDTNEGAECRECLHSETSRIHAACVRERELIVAFLRRQGAYALANRVSADHHVVTLEARAEPLSASRRVVFGPGGAGADWPACSACGALVAPAFFASDRCDKSTDGRHKH